jgi:glycosyltransferase involved in cell wall biosynthesis
VKICFLAHAGSIHTQRWISYFADQGYAVSLISFTPTELDYSDIELHLLTSRFVVSHERSNLHYLLHAPRLRQLLRELAPDLINAHFLSSYGFLGALTRPPGSSLVITLHGSDILLFPKRSPLHARVTRFALGRADMVVSVAQHITDTLPLYMSAGTPVLTIQYGLDVQQFHPPSRPTARRPVCFSNRAMVPVSNLETLIRAGRLLANQDSDLVIELAGSGEQLPNLRERVQRLDLQNRVRFIGQVAHGAMAEILRSAAIYVSTSTSDGASLSLLEAMACGAFPVVSDIPANREWIQDGFNGYLASADSSEELARKLDDAWLNGELRRLAAERNWQLIRKRADYQMNMARIEQSFVSLVNSRGQSRQS